MVFEHSMLTFLSIFLICLLCLYSPSPAEENRFNAWQEQAVKYAHIMSQVKWTPVAHGIPQRGSGYFEVGKEYTGLPYSNGGWEGRYIGFDIYLKTFLADGENPKSVLYTEDLRNQRPNSSGYYGIVCSSFTGYALQLAAPYASTSYPLLDGVRQVAAAEAAQIGDIIQRPGHVEIVTGITRDEKGAVTHVRVEDSVSPIPGNINYSVSELNNRLEKDSTFLCRITDRKLWRGGNQAESYLFPDFKADAEIPGINRVLLLDLGDWAPYRRNQTGEDHAFCPSL